MDTFTDNGLCAKFRSVINEIRVPAGFATFNRNRKDTPVNFITENTQGLSASEAYLTINIFTFSTLLEIERTVPFTALFFCGHAEIVFSKLLFIMSLHRHLQCSFKTP